VDRTTRLFGILIGGLALLAAAAPTLAAEPPADVAFDGVVTVIFHDPEYDNGNGIDGADVTLIVVDLAVPDVVLQEAHGSTDAAGVASFTDVARPTDPAVELALQVTAVRDRTFVDPDGCTVDEHLEGSASAAAGLEVTIDVEVIDQQDGLTCPPQSEPPPSQPPSEAPSLSPPIVVEGVAVEPDGDPLAIEVADATLSSPDGTATLAIETPGDGVFRVEVPAAADPAVERTLTVILIGPEVRMFVDEEGCRWHVFLVARGTWTVAGDVAPEPTTLVAAEELLQGECGNVQPPGSPIPPEPTTGGNIGRPRSPVAPNNNAGAATPHRTLPPSDTATDLGAEAGGVPAALLLLLTMSLSATVAARRFSRRGS
jgi:hypothetical protein